MALYIVSMHALPEQIDTRRLRLRVPNPADADTIFAVYAQDPLVSRYLAWSPHESVAVTRGFIAECLAGWSTGNVCTGPVSVRERLS